MNEFAFEVKQKAKIKINIYGKEYILHKPTVDEAHALANTNSSSNLDAAKRFMETLGLPLEVSGDMEIEHFNALLNVITDVNKKK